MKLVEAIRTAAESAAKQARLDAVAAQERCDEARVLVSGTLYSAQWELTARLAELRAAVWESVKNHPWIVLHPWFGIPLAVRIWAGRRA